MPADPLERHAVPKANSDLPPQTQLSRLERSIMDALYRLDEGTAADVLKLMPGEPSYDSVRVTFGILEKKGFVTHRRDGPRYVYRPTVPAERARSGWWR